MYNIRRVSTEYNKISLFDNFNLNVLKIVIMDTNLYCCQIAEMYKYGYKKKCFQKKGKKNVNDRNAKKQKKKLVLFI